MTQEVGDPDYRLKVVVIGAAGSGKTAMVDQLLTGKYNEVTKTTVGVDYRPYKVNISQNIIQLELWDTAGQETYKSVAKSYFRDAVGCVLVFDLTSQASFNELQFWLTQFRQLANPNAVILLVGNKLDLVEKREISADTAEQFAKDNLLTYLETSAVTSHNIKESFDRVARAMFDNIRMGKITIAGKNQNNSVPHESKEPSIIDITGEMTKHSAECAC
ncbi:Ras family protein [Tritrichomonas foetus]|uniref:Ras family protein n=1 Tax=Tritrichomonas foetus TaxID=1144522 RepID=A0A1J4KF77_9EUKA|nr:Ras family protein [Tritrichomonas foetus]|eukprot:OHT09584.1 Ras family protein [Tritrichomonas foetus]